MSLKYFDASADTADVITALQDDGAAVVNSVVDSKVVDAILGELRTPFDEVGRCDESDFNGYKTLRVSGILAISPTSAELVAHPRVMEVADGILLAHCINYRIGSLTAIEIHPGETDQSLHLDDGIYPVRMPGMQLQISAMWALEDFTEENGATRVALGSHRDSNISNTAEVQHENNIVQAVMPKGSVLLYLGTTWHGGGANTTDRNRHALFGHYRKRMLVFQCDPHDDFPPEWVDRLNDRQKELLRMKNGPGAPRSADSHMR